jgi:sugar lactone lactonase YvrE
MLYVSSHEGWILKFNPETGEGEKWFNTGGRPLGMVFNADHLIVADAYKGLLRITLDGTQTVLTNQYNGSPILYTDDVDVGRDGMVYFSDASSKFGAQANGGTYPASLLDLMEHGGHGRLFRYDPTKDETTLLVAGLNFANGVAVDPDNKFVLVNETGSYQIVKVWLTEERMGETEIVIDNLPGFPDNIVRGEDGRYWVGLASTRNEILDSLSEKPFLRRMVQRLPSALRPSAAYYGHVFAMDENGTVLASLQDPSGVYPVTTGAVEANGYLYISSLVATELGRMALPEF